MKLGILLCLWFGLISGVSGQEDKLSKVEFLEGIWQVEGKTTFEEWTLEQSNRMIGKSYKLQGGERKISEKLSISFVEGNLVYEATVLNQNGGQGIKFVLNEAEEEWTSFENLSHDFPKKIQYRLIDQSSLQVQVLGEGDKGFSYKMLKQ